MILLAPLLEALRRAQWEATADRLEPLFGAVAEVRRDLLERSMLAALAGNSIELEKVFHEAMIEAERLHGIGSAGTEGGLPYIHNIRFNHSTGRIHIGYGGRFSSLFAEDE